MFGDYIDVYDLTQAVEDGATVKIFYESRLAKVELPDEARQALDDEFAEVTEGTEERGPRAAKTRWARVEAIVGARRAARRIAADIVEHWETRREALAGKAMIVSHVPAHLRGALRRDRRAAPGLALRRMPRGDGSRSS